MNLRFSLGLLLAAVLLPLTARAQYPIQLGSAGQEYGKAMCTDHAGNVIVALLFQNTIDFDPGPSTTTLGTPPGVDLALVKYDRSGRLVWAKTLSVNGNGVFTPHAVGVDRADNIYVAGYFGNAGGAPATADFDPGPGVANLTNSGGWDPFIAKYDSNGNYLWAKTLGNTTTATGDERAWDLAIDDAGAVYVTGFFQGTYDLDAGPGTNVVTSAGGRDIFLVKYDAAGNHVWGFALGDVGDAANGLKETAVALDGRGHVFLQGHFNGTMDVDPGAGVTNLTSAGGSDLFVARYTTDGVFEKAMQIRGAGSEVAPPGAMRVDANGNIAMTGRFRGTVNLDPGTGTRNVTNTSTADNIFLASYTGDFALRWGFSIVSDGSLDGGHRVAFDSQQNVYMTGWFGGTADFDGGAGVFNLTSTNSNGASDVFLAKYSNAGAFLWAVKFGGTTADGTDQSIAAGLTVDLEDNPLITGQFYGTGANADPAPGKQRLLNSVGDNDCFILKYTAAGAMWDESAAPGSTRLVNLSTRAVVGTGGDVLIAGFVVTGTGAKTLLVRAAGPALAAFGVGNTLANPTLAVFTGSTSMATNDDWGTNTNLAAVTAAAQQVGAFAFPAGSRDSALLVTLRPGAYTAQVAGVGGTAGVALVEVYEVP